MKRDSVQIITNKYKIYFPLKNIYSSNYVRSTVIRAIDTKGKVLTLK